MLYLLHRNFPFHSLLYLFHRDFLLLLYLLHNYFSRNIRKFCFSGFAGFLLKYNKFFFWKKYKEFLSFGLESSISRNMTNVFKVCFFHFLSSESSLLKYKKYMRLESSIYRNIMNYLILELESSNSWNIRNFFLVDFLNFFELGLKSVPGSPIIHY